MSVQLAEPRRRVRRRTRAGHRGLRVWLVLALVIGAISVVGATTPVSGKNGAAGAASACAADSSGGCLVTLPCPTGQTVCPTVDVTPTTNLFDGQFVYVTAKGLPAGDWMRVALCTAATTSVDPQCLSGTWETQNYTPEGVPVTPDASGTTQATMSYPVFLDPAGQGNTAIPSADITNQQGPGGGFYCDDTADPCELVVTDETSAESHVGGPTISAANSAVVPLDFAAQVTGCPASDAQVNVANSYSITNFLPDAVDATCAAAGGVVAVNTSTDNTQAVGDYVAGSADVAFIDNPSDPAQVASLLGQGYSLIPVTLSGTSESFLGGAVESGNEYPIDSYNLTPNMAAGLLTSAYQQPSGSLTSGSKPTFRLADNLTAALAAATPPVTCTALYGCPKAKAKQVPFEQAFDTFDLLNPVPTGNYIGPKILGSFNANVASGSSYQATSWFCDAPNTPFDVTVAENPTVPGGQPVPTTVKVTDTNVASTTLVTPPLGSSIWPPYQGAKWIYPSCSGYSNLPALSATASDFSADETPALQAKAMRSWCYAGGVLPSPANPGLPCIAFGLMDSSQAQFYGLSTASLLNAAGRFVAPSTASLEAAANAMTPCPSGLLTCPAGTYTVNPANPDPAAYPLPDITYAVVPNTTLPYAKATAIKQLLTNLVDYSHSGAVPSGYAPLPDAMYQAAVADIANTVKSEPAPVVASDSSTTTTTTTASASGSGSGSGSGSSSGSGSAGDTGLATPISAGEQVPSTSALPETASATPVSSTGSPVTGAVTAPPASIPSGILLVGLAATTRFLLPAIVVLAMASLLGGLLLLFGPNAARRRHDHEEDLT